jgi:hypothetical protein
VYYLKPQVYHLKPAHKRITSSHQGW